MICKICSSENTKVTNNIQSPYFNIKYNLYHCNKCKSYFFDINQYQVDLESLYNEEYCDYNSEFKFSKYWDEQVKIIKKLIGKGENLNILDIGCRTGDFLMHFNKNNNFYGAEINKNNVSIARERGIIVYEDFIENIKFEKKFDIITCYALLEHATNPIIVLNKITDLLNDNGLLVIMIPTMECGLRKRLDKKNIHWHMYSPPQHLNYYSRFFLDTYMKEKEIKLIKRFYTSGGIRFRYDSKLSKSNDFYDINKFYTKNIDLVQSSSQKIMNKAYKCLLENRITNRYPYYDHMYSYYRKQ